MKSTKTLEFKFERTIPAPPGKVFAGWLNPQILGTPWHEADMLILNPKVGGFFYLLHSVYPHYGRFTKIERPGRIQHIWVSPNPLGQESKVTVTLKKQRENTLMTLVHSDLPDNEGGRAHEKGWNYYLGIFPGQFGDASRKKK